MSALAQAITAIKKTVQALPADEFGGVREPDLAIHVSGWTDLPAPARILGDLPPDVGDEVSIRVLGSYRPMASPGLVTLNLANLRRFYWSIVREMSRRLPGFPFPKQDLEFLAAFVVERTWHHEIFHHSIEVVRRLVGGNPYGPLEEALAVAYSRHCLRQSSWNSKVGRLGKVMLNMAMELAFDGYGPPYDQWPNYDSPQSLQRGIVELLQPNETGFLEASGVPVADLLWRLIPVQSGFHEVVIGDEHGIDLIVRGPEPPYLYCPFFMIYRGVPIKVEDNWTNWCETDLPLFRPDDKLQAMIRIGGEEAPLFMPADADDICDLATILDDGRNDRLKRLIAKAGLDVGEAIDQILYQIMLMREKALHTLPR